MALEKFNFEKLTFLIVDDNRHMRYILGNILRGFGVKQVIEATDGSDAFREMRSYAIDIAICDWVMEPLDGYDFVRLVRTAPDSPNKQMPIIMLTAYTEAFRIITARDAGVNEFMAKPISPKGLFKRITSIVKHPRQFVTAGSYFGPDRRRHKNFTYDGPERRVKDATQQEEAGLDQGDIDSLFG